MRNPSRTRLYLSVVVPIVGVTALPCLTAGVLQSQDDVSPEATPEIQRVSPDRAEAGADLTIDIEGRSFSRGVYVSFSNPAAHVVSTERLGATHLQAKVAIGKKAQPGMMSLYVSNPAGAVAEVVFTIAGGGASALPSSLPSDSNSPRADSQPSLAGALEGVSADPPRALQGSQISVKIAGKNFAKGAKVSFSNPGIRVIETDALSAHELKVKIQVAPDAPVGPTSLFVVNPDDSETEARFEVGETASSPPAAATGVATTSQNPGSQAARFEVYDLGEAISLLQSPNKPKGILTFAAGKLKYKADGKVVFSASSAEIKEIDANSFLGVNTGTFHVILNSGKTYNFVAASLRLAESQAIVDSLRRALH